jgi:hypothetical protein
MATWLTDKLQSWARCAKCLEVIWCEASKHDQAAGCRCGDLRLVNGRIVKGKNDPTFTADDMEAVIAKDMVDRTL